MTNETTAESQAEAQTVDAVEALSRPAPEDMSDAEGDAWDTLHDDTDIICTCDGCNFYSPTYDDRRECSLNAHIEAVVAARFLAAGYLSPTAVREREAAAWEMGRAAERRDWEFTADLSTPDEDRQPWPNPFKGGAS